MNITFLKNLLSRTDINIIIIGTATGGILQIISSKYLKNHPNFLEEEDKNGGFKEAKPKIKNKKRKSRFRLFSPRGGDFVKVSLGSISIKSVKVVVKFIANKGLLAGFLGSSGGLVLTKIPSTAVSTYLRDSFQQNLPHLEKKKFILVKGKKLYLDLDQCDQNLEYLFNMLTSSEISDKDKKDIANSVLKKYINLKTLDARVKFVICVTGLLIYLYSIGSMGSYYLILKKLIQAIREGKIPKVVGRAIIRKLKKKSIPVSPELLEITNS